MTAAHVLLLEAAGPESGALARAATAAGHRVHAATTADMHATYDDDLRALLSGALLTDFAHPTRALTEVVGYAHRIDAAAVLTVNEYLTPLLARVCAALGLPGNDPTLADAARDKAAMYAAFIACGVSTPRTRFVEDADELVRLGAAGQLTFPCVVKPTGGAGSAGVTVAGTVTEAAMAWTAARAVRGMYATPGDPHVLVQEYIDGAEYSVESVTQAGTTRHLCATRKTVTTGTHRVETGHSLPAGLPAGAEQLVYQQVERAIAAVGIRNSASHTEVILTPDGRCVVVEIGARLGAGHIGALIHHALGIDPWAALLAVALGQPADLTPTRRGYAAVRFLTSPRPGRLVV